MSIYGNVYDSIYGELDEDKNKKKYNSLYGYTFNTSTPTYNLYANNTNNSQLGGYGDKISSILTPAIKGTSSYMKTGKTPWGAIGAVGKQGYNLISGKDDKDYSDLEESIIYPIQGASIGASFGPWGALGGALYGLGYSFKDDTNKLLGIKEGSFWDKLRHPIGMGDGGGFIDLG